MVNDGGPDPAPGLSHYADRMNLRWLQQENSGPARARNRGVELALGQRVVFLDDDCQPAPNWLASLERVAEKQPQAMIGGRTVNRLEHNPYAATSQLLMDFLYEQGANSNQPLRRFFSTNNMSVPRNRFVDLGGFCESFRHAAGEDREFCLRWQQADLPLHYDPEILVGHLHSMGASKMRATLRGHDNSCSIRWNSRTASNEWPANSRK